MSNLRRMKFSTLVVALMMPLLAHAHMEDAAAGFMSGLLHPINGLDHFLAMISVGIVSMQLGGRNAYTLPGMFVAAMVVGGLVGTMGKQIPYIEHGIALSVIVLGAAIALVKEGGKTLPVMLVTMFFGFLHGYAHGVEMPKAVDPVFYAAGFVTSTATIHLMGVGLGYLMMIRYHREQLLRHLGSVISGMGIMIMLGALSLI